MSQILFITVGGSHQPIVTAIQMLKPERVIFICSTGKRGSETQVIGKDKPCEVRRGQEVIERLPNIPTQVNLDNRFNPDTDLVRLDDPDDLAENYSKIAQRIQEIQKDNPDAKLLADYTGGTKTMSVTLALAALDYRLTLYLTTGNRIDLSRVYRGEFTGKTNITPMVVKRTLEQFLPPLIAQYNYSGAIAELKNLLSDFALPTNTRHQIQNLYTCLCGLDAWDRFDHRQAWELLGDYMRHPIIQPLAFFLKKVLASRNTIDPNFNYSEGTPGHGYEIVLDLLLNAERRAVQEKYDDAVGRLYRALELLAQIRLAQNYNIATGDVNLEQLPKALHAEYEKKRSPKGTIQLALTNSYQLLAKLDDPLGQIYSKNSQRLLDILQIRNYSLFAHGFSPITQVEYEKIEGTVNKFITEALKVATKQDEIKSVQFPQELSFE